MNDEMKNSEGDGSVWASYSDLFTNVAIIFLVMFVFALVRSTVSQIKSAHQKQKHENELKGKLSKKEAELNTKRIKKVEEAVTEMQKYESVIDEKVAELNEYAKKLQTNKQLLKDVIAAQEKQDSLLKASEEKLQAEEELRKEKQFALEAAELRVKVLNEELVHAELEVKQRESNYQKKLQEKSTALETTQKQFSERMSSLTSRLAKAETDAATLRKELSEKNALDESRSHELNTYKRQLASLESELEHNKTMASDLGSERKRLSDALSKLTSEQNQLKKEYANLLNRSSQSEANASEKERKLNEVSAQLKNLQANANQWKTEFQKQFAEAAKLKGLLSDSQKKFNELATTMTKLKDSVKNNVATKLSEKFKEAHLPAEVNLKTGEVILLSGEGFHFEKGSAKLSKDAKSMLKKLIPVYASVLLGDEAIYSQIHYISMEGHSSPSFGGKFINPEEGNSDAYSFNMRLSAMRAASVANYLMSDEIGPYPHKARMKQLLHSVGYGFMKPVPAVPDLNRLPASETGCGPWDCIKSQRVQINFLLKDNLEEILKIIDANGAIK